MFNIYLKKLFFPSFSHVSFTHSPQFYPLRSATARGATMRPRGDEHCARCDFHAPFKPTGAHVALNGAWAEAVGLGRMQ